MMTFKELLSSYKEKLQRCNKEITKIELTADKKRRIEWRELKKVKKYYEEQIAYLEYQISIGNNDYESAGWITMK